MLNLSLLYDSETVEKDLVAHQEMTEEVFFSPVARTRNFPSARCPILILCIRPSSSELERLTLTGDTSMEARDQESNL